MAMRILFISMIACLLVFEAKARSIMAGGYAGAIKETTVIVFRADGSVILTNDTLQGRKSIEQTVRMYDAYANRADLDDDESLARPMRPTINTNAMTDQELSEKIRKMASETSLAARIGNEPKVDLVDVTTNTVRVVSTIMFTNVHDFVARSMWLLAQTSLPIGNFEVVTTNNQLRVTLSPNEAAKRYSKMIAEQWNSMGTNEVRLVFPGKVLTSGLGPVEGNATWLSFGGSSSNGSVQAAFKLMEKPVMITAEPGGLKIDQALSSKALQRTVRFGGGDDEDADDGVPVTDAGPGFIVEALSVTTSTSYLFPEGEKLMTAARRYSSQEPGVKVQAKLFAPKERTILKVTDLRVIKAVDDKGRDITAAKKSDDDDRESDMEQYTSFSSSGSAKGATVIYVQVPLPARDAQSIAEVNAEAVATTVGKWNEIAVTNSNPNATNEFDLGSILPGAKLVVRKVRTRASQVTIDADLKGSKEVHRIEVKYRSQPGGQDEDYDNSSMYARKVSTAGGVTTRSLQISHYGFGDEAPRKDAPAVLLVRYPTDLKRERVKLKLENLDLF